MVDFPSAKNSSSSLRTFLLSRILGGTRAARFIIHFIWTVGGEQQKAHIYWFCPRSTGSFHLNYSLIIHFHLNWFLHRKHFIAIFSIQMTFLRICIFANSPQHNLECSLLFYILYRLSVVELSKETTLDKMKKKKTSTTYYCIPRRRSKWWLRWETEENGECLRRKQKSLIV